LAQGLDDALGCDVPGATIHDVEHLARLVDARVGVGVAVDGLQCPLGILELHLLILALLWIHLLFALILVGMCAILMRLLLLLTELFRELLNFPALSGVVAHGVMHRALHCRHRCWTLDGGACSFTGHDPHQPPLQL
jgi:hypothetical protein